MALELKMINRCFHPIITKFTTQAKFSSKPLYLIQKSRKCSDSFFPKSFSPDIYPSSIIQNTDNGADNRINILRGDYKSIPKSLLSQDFGAFTNYANHPLRWEDCSGLITPETGFQKNTHNLIFTPIGPQKTETQQHLLQSNKKPLEYLKGLPKTLFRLRKNDDKKPKRRIPKLILIQNPFTWLMIKIDFSVLRNIWDPSFREKEFKYGTKQAISKITNVISDGQYSELNGLLTKAARLSLMRELDRNWSEKQRTLLALEKEDIQISSPRKVYFIRIADKKYCDVDMAFLALKWAPINSIEALIFTEIFARFHREYTPHCIPEWTIAYFKVTRFEVLRRKPRTVQ